MTIEVAVKKTEPMTVAFIFRKAHFSQIPQAFGVLYPWLQQKGYTPSGPPLGVYYSDMQQVPPEEMEWELWAPISDEVAPFGADEQGLGVKTVEAIDVACTMHKGPYDQVGPVYGELFSWIVANGYEVAGPPQEVYLNDPGPTHAADLLTEIRFPVKKK